MCCFRLRADNRMDTAFFSVQQFKNRYNSGAVLISARIALDGISQRVNAELVQQFRLFWADASYKPNVIRQLHTS